MTEPVIGIDLGTTNSVVAFTDETGMTLAIANEDGDRILPSVVYFQEGGDPIVGTVAKESAVLEPTRVAQLFKRGMGELTFLDDKSDFVVDGKIWRPQELSALVLKKLKQTAEAHFGTTVTKAVITVPAYFGFDERQATETAGEIAGLEVLQLMNEPTAAAVAHRLDGDTVGKVLVFDLGGGTFDVTVMDIGTDGHVEVLSTTGDHRLGGADFDNLIIERMTSVVREQSGFDLKSDRYALQDARSRAEELKKDLSRGRDSASKALAVGGKPVKFTLSVAEFEEMLDDYLTAIQDHVELAITKAKLKPTDISTALMVGGSSRILCMPRLLAKIIGKTPIQTKNMDEDVARGAAMMAVKLLAESRPTEHILDSRTALGLMPKPQDIVTHALGTTVLNDKTGKLYNHVMVKVGAHTPAREEEVFGAVSEGQTEIETTINQGDSADLDLVDTLSKARGRFSRPVPKGHPIRDVMEVSESGLIRLKTYDGKDNTLLCQIEVQSDKDLSSAAKAEAKSALRAMKVE